ncbi:MAG: hypothetical protein AABW54_00335 [Candidatus Micrarchaeota archaeon]
MILMPRSLREMEKQLRGVPAGKRRVIVLVRRHVTEGTGAVAQRHHRDWEKLGAVAVRIPPKWTPLAFWREAQEKNLSVREINARLKRFVNDGQVCKFLLESGFRVPVVNFHGFTQPFYSGMTPLADYSRLDLNVRRAGSLLHEHPSFSNGTFSWWAIAPNELLVELCVVGRGMKDLLSKRFKDKIESTIRDGRLDYPDDQLNLEYLEGECASRRTLDVFSRQYAKRFEAVLKHLARTGLKEERAKR